MKHEHMLFFRLAQIRTLIKLSVAFFLSLFYKRRIIWLVAERGVDARDNGYWFFRYMRTEHPDIETYYLITKSSPDYARLTPYVGHVIEFGSLYHFIMLWRASVLISAHVQGYFPFGGLGLWLRKVLPPYRHKYHINIKHGITKDYYAFLDYSNTHLDLITAGVYQEYEYFKTVYRYPAEIVQLTGFCRFDGLNSQHVKQQILIMPTWREWLYTDDGVLQSEYLKKYISLLNNPRLLQIAENKQVNIVFYPHHEVQKHLHIFKQHCQNKRVIIADEQTFDVQQLLVESKLLLTDYSSVYFDFAYMRKPIIFYQFDKNRYRKEHYKQGWYDYENGLGAVVTREGDCISLVEQIFSSDFVMSPIYRDYADKMFAYRDNGNCERVFNAICSKVGK